MMDLLEELFAFRRHRWLRLDGSTPIAERRDLVDAWQGSDTYFVFLLSTRAGGLGINLTAADTVIFYESDWNPTMDLQVRGEEGPAAAEPGPVPGWVLVGVSLWSLLLVVSTGQSCVCRPWLTGRGARLSCTL